MLLSRIHKIVEKALPEVVPFALTVPPDARFGDLATNAALLLAKQIGKSPREVAEQIIAKLDSKFIERAEVAGPGFINLFLKDEFIWKTAREKIVSKLVTEKSDLIVVDFGGENIAKPMSVGHLRSNIIGQALCNIYKFRGWRIVGDNHLGDWGTQFGKLIVAWNKWAGDKNPKDATIQELNDLYVRFHEEAEKNPELEDEARALFAELERLKLKELEMRRKKGHESIEEGGEALEFINQNEILCLWNIFVQGSLEEFQGIRDRLKVKFSKDNSGWNKNNTENYVQIGESFYLEESQKIIERGIQEGVLKESEGAIVAKFEEEGWSPLLFQKSDGATLYATRDLAAIDFRLNTFEPKKIIYVVGSDQELQFRQLFIVAKKFFGEKIKNTELFHAKFGMVRLPEGKMSTRKGRVVRLEDLLDEAREKMAKILEEKNPNLLPAEREVLAEKIGVGAVIFADLGQARESNITFTWEKALSFDGYAAPYLMYTHARAHSILRKARLAPDEIERVEIKLEKFNDPSERTLAYKFTQFHHVVEEAAENYHPHVIAQYLFELAQLFNSFYHKLPVLNASNEAEKNLRLALVSKTIEVLKQGLELLNISAPEKM